MDQEGPDAPADLAQAAQPAPLGAQAFHDLIIATLPKLRQQAFALARNRVYADDLVQGAVANALAAKDSFAPGTNFQAWMARILRNKFLSDRRRHRDTVDVDDAPRDVFACSGGQEDSVALAELRKALAWLPDDQRLALLMVSAQGMSYEEASVALGVAEGTLKCRVFRARKLLQAWLLGEDDASQPGRPAKPGRPGKRKRVFAPQVALR